MTDPLNSIDTRGMSALMSAAEACNGEAIERLIDYNGADETPADSRVDTAFFHAVLSPHDVIRHLFRSGADLSARITDGDTAGLYAARKGATEALDWFLFSPRQVYFENNRGRNALMLAAQGGKVATQRPIIDSWGGRHQRR